ncbi:MAG: hypothetical protein ABEJ22_00520 [Haloferacaceae archaeon]
MPRQFGPAGSDADETVQSLAGKSTSVLLLSDRDAEVCSELLHPEPVETENLLWVLYDDTPDRRLRTWKQQDGGTPANLGIVSVGDQSRSAAASSDGGTGSGLIETLAHPEDLTGLGIRIDNFLNRWEDASGRTAVCFDSLTTLLQYVDDSTAFRFMNVLTTKLYAANAFAHFHMNPGAHDDRTVAKMSSLVDAVVESTDDGWTVRSR